MRGFVLVELIIVIGIFTILVVVAIISAFSFRANIELMDTANEVIEELRLAQSKTTASEDASAYGIHLESDRITLFKGSDFSSRNSAFDEVYIFPQRVEISSWDVGGDDIVFERISGSTQNSGTITFCLASNPAKTKSVSISASGEAFLSGDILVFTDSRIIDTRHVHYDLGWSMASSTIMTLFFPSIPDVTETISIQDFINGGRFDWSGTVNVNDSSQTLRIHTHFLDSFNTVLSVHRGQDENDNALDISIDGNLVTSYDAIGNVTPGPFGESMEVQ